jgi:hypothetical protein
MDGPAATTLKGGRPTAIDDADDAPAERRDREKRQEGDQKAETDERWDAGAGSDRGMQGGAEGAVVRVGIGIVGIYAGEMFGLFCVVVVMLEVMQKLGGSGAQGEEGQEEET